MGMVMHLAVENLASTNGTEQLILSYTGVASSSAKVLGWGIYFNGVSATAEPINVKLIKPASQSTPADTGLVALAAINDAMTAVGTANSAYGTIGTVAKTWDIVDVHPQSGYEVKYPFGQEPQIGSSGVVALRLLQASGQTNVSMTAKLIIDA